MIMLNFVIFVIFIMLSVAFFTLMERKILSYMQYRKGPNKIGYIGIFQPFSDAMKLFTKEILKPSMSNMFFYFLMPIFNLMVSILVWILFPNLFSYIFFNLGFFFFLCLSSLSIYSIILSSWSSNSNYSLLGSLRSIAQMISYEISFSMILLSFLFLTNSLSLYNFFIFQNKIWFIFILLPISIMLMISCLAETNRTPFDFSEGESELVSGFNIEYSSILFTFIFLSEYCSIMFISSFMIILMFGSDMFSFLFYFKINFMCFFFIWIRASLPRFRYDKLMILNWKIFLPISIFYLFLCSSISVFLKMIFFKMIIFY